MFFGYIISIHIQRDSIFRLCFMMGTSSRLVKAGWTCWSRVWPNKWNWKVLWSYFTGSFVNPCSNSLLELDGPYFDANLKHSVMKINRINLHLAHEWIISRGKIRKVYIWIPFLLVKISSLITVLLYFTFIGCTIQSNVPWSSSFIRIFWTDW